MESPNGSAAKPVCARGVEHSPPTRGPVDRSSAGGSENAAEAAAEEDPGPSPKFPGGAAGGLKKTSDGTFEDGPGASKA